MTISSESSDGLPDPMDLACQLSSPISSYEIYNGPEGPCIRHQSSYSIRLISTKETIQQMKDDIKFLKEAEMERQKISVNWGIHYRIAQAINDTYICNVPQQQYRSLRAAGHGYLPCLLTAWAMDLDVIPTALANEIDDDECDQYRAKINSLWRQNLINNVPPIWHAVPLAARNLMITMWIKRHPSRSGIGHPIPSVTQARNLIRLDKDLTLAEINLAEAVIPVAVGKNGNRLFNDDSSGNLY